MSAQSSQQSSQQPSQTTPAPSASQQSGASGSGSATTRISIPQSAPVGGLTITMPPQTATSFYKIAQSNPVTFGWNFTGLYSQPAHLTLHAVGENSNTYPVGPSDGIIDGTATSVVWDLYEYNQQNPNTPLAQGSYNLRIWDDRGADAVRAPGLFDPNSALKFALYSPAAYTPLASGESDRRLASHSG